MRWEEEGGLFYPAVAFANVDCFHKFAYLEYVRVLYPNSFFLPARVSVSATWLIVVLTVITGFSVGQEGALIAKFLMFFIAIAAITTVSVFRKELEWKVKYG